MIITTRKRLRDLIARELADMVETDPKMRQLVAKVARSSAKDWLQDRFEEAGSPFHAEVGDALTRLFKAAVR